MPVSLPSSRSPFRHPGRPSVISVSLSSSRRTPGSPSERCVCVRLLRLRLLPRSGLHPVPPGRARPASIRRLALVGGGRARPTPTTPGRGAAHSASQFRVRSGVVSVVDFLRTHRSRWARRSSGGESSTGRRIAGGSRHRLPCRYLPAMRGRRQNPDESRVNRGDGSYSGSGDGSHFGSVRFRGRFPFRFRGTGTPDWPPLAVPTSGQAYVFPGLTTPSRHPANVTPGLTRHPVAEPGVQREIPAFAGMTGCASSSRARPGISFCASSVRLWGSRRSPG